MTQGVSGYFDIAGSENFTGRFFYSEEYDKTNGKRIFSIDGISIQSTVYGGTWYPGGTVKVEGKTICTMTYEGTTTHMVSVGASTAWHELTAIENRGVDFPWVSSEIASNADGSKSVTIDVDITLWRATDRWKTYIKGSYTVDLTNVPLGLVYIKENGEFVPYQCYIKNGENWDMHIPYIKNGVNWDMYS